MELEFWVSPNAEIMVTDLVTRLSEPLHPAHPAVQKLADKIRVIYPEAYNHLRDKYRHRTVVNYRIVKNFIACNFYINDAVPDFTEDGTLNLENVPCPLKALNICPEKNIVCNPCKKIFTPSETNVLGLIKKCKTNKEIADELNISVETVKTHKRNMKQKTSLKSTFQLCSLLSLTSILFIIV